MDQAPVSIIVPALNEAESLPLLVPRIAAAMNGRAYEVIVVDDNSRDRTPEVCAELARHYPLTLLTRTEPKDGLSGAVLHGMARANGRLLVVMDADLQHPPEKIPELLRVIESGEADFALGSRYTAGGSTAGKWGLFRRINSSVATVLARPFAGKVRDPMSGFFALSRDTYRRARALTPLGYKIALELICKCRVRRVQEVPIHFALRERGHSKLTLKQQFRYLEHLSRLYDFTFPRLSPMVKFLIALACGWGAAAVVYACLAHVGGVTPFPAVVISYGVAILVTAVFHARYVNTQREFLPRNHPWRDFLLIAAAEWAGCATVAFWIAKRAPGIHPLEAFVIPFACATTVRYVLRKELLQDLRGLRRRTRRERELGVD